MSFEEEFSVNYDNEYNMENENEYEEEIDKELNIMMKEENKEIGSILPEIPQKKDLIASNVSEDKYKQSEILA